MSFKSNDHLGTAYPLRPEHAESLFMLSTAVPDDLFLSYGADMIENINNITRVVCRSLFLIPNTFFNTTALWICSGQRRKNKRTLQSHGQLLPFRDAEIFISFIRLRKFCTQIFSTLRVQYGGYVRQSPF